MEIVKDISSDSFNGRKFAFYRAFEREFVVIAFKISRAQAASPLLFAQRRGAERPSIIALLRPDGNISDAVALALSSLLQGCFSPVACVSETRNESLPPPRMIRRLCLFFSPRRASAAWHRPQRLRAEDWVVVGVLLGELVCGRAADDRARDLAQITLSILIASNGQPRRRSGTPMQTENVTVETAG